MSPSEDNTSKKSDPSKAKKAMRDMFTLVKKMGAGAIDLLKKLKKDKSPEAMMRTLEASVAANQERRESVAARVEKLYNDIVTKKKAFASAPKARQRILETELATLLASYKAAERELSILLENERVLAQTKGRMQEVMAYGMAGVTEIQIDDVIDEIEESVDAAEARMDATRDLEKAGKRRERESEKDSLWNQLGDFGEEEKPSKLADDLAGFEEDPPKQRSKEKEEQ